MAKAKDYSAIGWQYAQDVVDGRIPAALWTKKACQRALDDRANIVGYRYDEARGNRICAFIELLPHVKGALGGKTITLEAWQCWVLTQTFGWLCEGGPRDGMRRFRTVYIEVPRGNAKSTLSSGIALYCLAADGGYGEEVYVSATTQHQARIVFGDAQSMARSSVTKRLMSGLGVKVNAHTITVENKNSKLAPTSAEYTNMDGFNISCSIVDELHAHQDRGLWDVLVTGAGKRPYSLIWAITTAGSDRTGVCYEQRTYLTRLLDRVITDETFFGAIWGADDKDDWLDEATWVKANPNWGVSVEPDYIRSQARKAEQTPAAQAAFQTKHLCRWVSTSSAWMNMLAWDRCHDPDLNLADFEGRDCIIGLDLASKVDLAAKIRLFWREIDGVQHFYVFGNYYLPEQAIHDGRNAQYSGWQTTGLLTATPGDVIDFGTIENHLMNDARTYNVWEMAYDPWQATQLAQRMSADGAQMVEFRPTTANFSAAMKEIEALVKDRRLHHNDPILSWCVSNVVARTDANDNIFPRKERVENKIDGLIALLMAMGRYIANDYSSVYEKHGLLVLST